MVEIPQTPIACAVAGLALRAHAALVDIVIGMASAAFFRRFVERLRLVAGGAGRRPVLSKQRKRRRIMVDFRFLPVFRGMAAFAALAQLAFMCIFVTVAGDTARVELVFVEVSGMAAGTCGTAVRTQ